MDVVRQHHFCMLTRTNVSGSLAGRFSLAASRVCKRKKERLSSALVVYVTRGYSNEVMSSLPYREVRGL
jgi:hypothetical protein